MDAHNERLIDNEWWNEHLKNWVTETPLVQYILIIRLQDHGYHIIRRI